MCFARVMELVDIAG